MAEALELLRKVPVFEGLSDDHITWFLSHSQEVRLKPGDSYVRQGDPADSMFVMLDGEFQWRGEIAGETVVLPVQAGAVTGILPFSRMRKYTLSGRAMTEARILRFPAS